MTSTQVAGMLHLLKAEPTLLPSAPIAWTGRDIETRRLDEVHSCLRCGSQARCAFVADTALGPRWLDLCPSCEHWLRRGLDDLAFLDPES